jgi:glutathione S-transferase
VIVLRAKAVDFDVTYINLREKPDWFLEISPHGKVPVLKVEGQPLFESNAIAEYLEEATSPALHPEDLIKRARNRAWTDFVPDFAKALSGVYYTKTQVEMDAGIAAAPEKLAKVEAALATERDNDGPYFNGDSISLVDAAYAPFFQRFCFVDAKLNTGLFEKFPRVKAWCDALLSTDQVTGSVSDAFEADFVANLKRRGFIAGDLFDTATSEAAD